MNERELWDERFREEAYVYGTEPNRFLVEMAEKLPPGGTVLSLGAGEGRNEVWLAERGFEVTAVDSSSVGLDKLQRLAATRNVHIETKLADVRDFHSDADHFDVALLIFLHLASADRPAFHGRIWNALKPGGYFLSELFRAEQIAHDSGGPRNPDFLYEENELPRDFQDAKWEVLRNVERELSEGVLHLGDACLIQAMARKPFA